MIRSVGELLSDGERRVDHGEAPREPEAALALGEEDLLRRAAGADVGDPLPGDPDRALCREPERVGESRLEQNRRLPPVGRGQRSALGGRDAVDVGAVRGYVDTDDPARHRDGLAVLEDLDLSEDHQPLLGGFDVLGDGVVRDRVRECPRRHRAPLGQLDAQIMHREGREARVVGGHAPRLEAAEARVEAGAERH